MTRYLYNSCNRVAVKQILNCYLALLFYRLNHQNLSGYEFPRRNQRKEKSAQNWTVGQIPALSIQVLQLAIYR